MKAHLKNVRISPKKVNLVADLVRKMQVNQAISLLDYTPKKAARILRKLIASAAANAKNNNSKNVDTLSIAEIKVSKGLTIKRFNPISRGRAHPINKFCSHIHVILKEDVAEPTNTAKKAEVKEEKITKKVEAKKPAAKKATTAKKTATKKAPTKKAATTKKAVK
ncbi:50S ribosomal protein L22 [bacterium]|nr:50S ribosomal protein L22 [bacterium]